MSHTHARLHGMDPLLAVSLFAKIVDVLIALVCIGIIIMLTITSR